jgi:hypothetical protein
MVDALQFRGGQGTVATLEAPPGAPKLLVRGRAILSNSAVTIVTAHLLSRARTQVADAEGRPAPISMLLGGRGQTDWPEPFNEVVGALVSGPNTMAGDVDVKVAVAGAMVSGANAMAGDVDVRVTAAGALASGANSIAGDIDVHVVVAGALTSGPNAMLGDVDVKVALSGALTSGSNSLAGAIEHAGQNEVSGAMVSGQNSITGDVDVLVSVTGALTSGANHISGRARRAEKPLTTAQVLAWARRNHNLRQIRPRATPRALASRRVTTPSQPNRRALVGVGPR